MKKRIKFVVLVVMLIWLLLVMGATSFLSVIQSKEVIREEFEEQINVEQGQEENFYASHMIEIEKSGTYILKANWETDSEELVTGFVLLSPEGEVKNCATGNEVQLEMLPVRYEKGTYELRFHFMTDEATLKRFAENNDLDAEIFDGWPAVTESCYVKGDYSLEMRGLSDVQEGFMIGTVLVSIVILILVTIAWRRENKDVASNMNAKSTYAFMGGAMAVYATLVVALQMIYPGVMTGIFGDDVVNTAWYDWLQIIIPTYGIAFIILIMWCTRIEKTSIEQHKMTVGQFICCVCMNTGICAVGAVIGNIVNMSILTPFGAGNSGVLAELMMNSNDVWRILTVGIGAPIFEELVFRKFLIDRVCKYGEGLAIVTSGIMFGLFHGNFQQFFFAAGLGFFFAFIYLRTGKIWYTIAFHMIINLSSAMVMVPLVKSMDFTIIDKLATMDPMAVETQQLAMQILSSLMLLLGWLLILFVFALAGIILWIIKAKKLYLVKQVEETENKKVSTVFGNFGMVYFILLCMYLFVQYYVSMICLV